MCEPSLRQVPTTGQHRPTIHGKCLENYEDRKLLPMKDPLDDFFEDFENKLMGVSPDTRDAFTHFSFVGLFYAFTHVSFVGLSCLSYQRRFYTI